jgi:hypothetical protein
MYLLPGLANHSNRKENHIRNFVVIQRCKKNDEIQKFLYCIFINGLNLTINGLNNNYGCIR